MNFIVTALVSAEELDHVMNVPLRGEDKHPSMLLVLGWLCLVLFDSSIYQSRIRRYFV